MESHHELLSMLIGLFFAAATIVLGWKLVRELVR